MRRFARNLTVQVLFAVTCGVLLGVFAPDVAKQMRPLGDEERGGEEHQPGHDLVEAALGGEGEEDAAGEPAEDARHGEVQRPRA